VTRRPLVLQLHKTDDRTEYAEFLHLPKKRFTDFGKGTRCICLWDISRIFWLLNVLGIKVALESGDLVSARVTFYFS
jgi:hypothetical protein